MESYQVVAIAVMFAMGVVVNSTMKLNNYRKTNGVVKTAINLRDLSVIKQPQDFDVEEVRLVRNSWLACAAAFALVVLMLVLIPADVVGRFQADQQADETPSPKSKPET